MAKRVSLFKVLRRELGTFLAAQGFVEVPQDKSFQTNHLVFFRKTPKNKSVGFWFQRDVNAFHVDVLGSSFTLEFFTSLKEQSFFDHNKRKRYSYLLHVEELEELRQLQNRMIMRLPPLVQVFELRESEIFINWAKEQLEIIKKPLKPSDIWMRYRDEVDLLAWTKFIEQHLPLLVERFLLAKSK